MYTFECQTCGEQEVILRAIKNRDNDKHCLICGQLMERLMDVPTLGKPAYQMGAVMADGRTVSGHFGKSAKKK